MFSDWIFVRWFGEHVRGLTLRQVVEGGLHAKPSYWFTGEFVVREGELMPSSTRRLDTALVRELSQTVRSSELMRSKLLASLWQGDGSGEAGTRRANAAWGESASSVLSQKTAIAVISFLESFVRENGFALFAQCLDRPVLQILVKRRDEVLRGKKRSLADGTFVDDTALLQQYYDALSFGNVGLQTRKVGTEQSFAGKQFFCRAMSADDLRAVLRLNMGPLSVDYILDKKEGNRLYSVDEICNKLAASTQTALQTIDAQGAWFRRRVIYYMGQFLITVSGWYTCINDVHASISGSRDMAPTLIALAAMARYANPMTMLMQALRASVTTLASASVGTLMMVLPPLAFGALLMATRGSRTFDRQVAAGVSTHPLSSVRPTAPRAVEDGVSKFGVAEALATAAEVRTITQTMERFDDQVRSTIARFRQHPGKWQRERAILARDFTNVCADFSGSPQSLGTFLSQYNLDRTTWSKWVSIWDVKLFGLPQQFLSVLKPTLTLEDIIDAHGAERNSHEICAAIYLRAKTEAKPMFENLFSRMTVEGSRGEAS